MGTLYIDRKGLYVKLDGNALCFYMNGQREGMVPITPLKRVVVLGNITFESSVLHRFSDENISVIFLSGRNMRFCGMLHGRLHNNGLLRVKQYEKSLNHSFSAEFAHETVSRKINAQLHSLQDALPSRLDLRLPLSTGISTLNGIADSLKTFDEHIEIKRTMDSKSGILNLKLNSLRGFEGSGAAAYFSAYTSLFPDSLNFKNRNRRPPKDPVNAMLSLCYTMLHYEMVREIEIIGLDPTIGFYHQFEYGRESLACDLVELYRHEVDTFLWNVFRERIFTSRDFSFGKENPGCYLAKGGRSRFYPLYEEWAKRMRPLFTSEVRALAQKIMDGTDISGEYNG